MLEVALAIDASPAVQAIERLLAEFLESPLEVRQALVGGLETLGEAAFSARVDLDVGAASGASQQRVVLEPSESLLALAAALRAGDVHFGVVQDSGRGRVLSLPRS